MPEMGALSKEFDRVILVPGNKIDECALDLSAFPNVEVDTTWLSCPKSGKMALSARTLASGWFWRGALVGDWRSLHKGVSGVSDYFRIVRGLVAFRAWFADFVRMRGLSLETTLFYTFWFSDEATALGLMGVRNRDVKAITRMHGFDMFEFRNYPIVQLRMLRSGAMRGLLQIHPVSDCGTEYVQKIYPKHRQKISTEYLGVRDLLPRCRNVRKDTFGILSVSNVIALKRVELVFRCLSALASAFPGKSFEWTHVGGGNRFAALQDLVASGCPPNLSVRLLGAVTNEEVRSLLSQTPFDLGVHLSESEGGTPIAILEMLGAGIPVVACDAGGVRECVNDEDGVLLPIEIEEKAFVKAVEPLVSNPSLRERKADAAATLVATKFRASDCRQRWAKKLVELLNGWNS